MSHSLLLGKDLALPPLCAQRVRRLLLHHACGLCSSPCCHDVPAKLQLGFLRSVDTAPPARRRCTQSQRQRNSRLWRLPPASSLQCSLQPAPPGRNISLVRGKQVPLFARDSPEDAASPIEKTHGRSKWLVKYVASKLSSPRCRSSGLFVACHSVLVFPPFRPFSSNSGSGYTLILQEEQGLPSC